jgi:hypothetical protein
LIGTKAKNGGVCRIAFCNNDLLMALRALLLLLIVNLPDAHSQANSPIRQLFRFVATDSKGTPVTDLRAEQIRASDAGRSASIAFSRLVPITLPSIAPREPGEFSNRPVSQPLSSILILLDLFNTDFTAESNSFQDLIRAVEKPESSNIGLVFLAPDASLLTVRESPAPGARVRALTAGQLRQALKTAEKLHHLNVGDAGFNAQRTREALENLGSRFSALPGQKRLIWMTRGTPLAIAGPKGSEPMIFQTIMQQTAEEFRQFAIPVYTAGSFAALTGGRNFENEAVEKVVAQAQRDAGATYLAAFYAPAVSDDKLHELRVSTTRKGGRIVAADVYTGDTAAPELRLLEQAESQIADTPDLALRVAVSIQGGTAHFRVYVDARSILLAFMFLDVNGGKTVTEPVRSAVTASVPVPVDLPVPAGTTKVRIAVEDPSMAAVGTLTIPVS